MNPKSWQRVARLFTAIVEQPAATWPRLLDELGGGDQLAVRREVERLLQAEQRGLGFLDEPLLRLGELLPAAAIRHAAPLRAGPYRLLRPIGRGAASEVFLGVRDDDVYRRRVAVKLIRAGCEERSVLRRFLAERQILASLDHPHIARLYGGGTSDDGRPYLAMEYVDGLPITEYCDRRRLAIAPRLELFLAVCSAVQHAHQRLLVHRDLKPCNILVTAAGEAKLLDFGIAKPLGPREGLEQRTTENGQRPMTLDFASPEQVRGETITIATDVYSLGVLLFELLSGQRPYLLDSELPHELERAICEQEVESPSVALARAGGGRRLAAGASAAELRSCTLPELRRRLRGDLDIIVGRALEKDPARRYDSVRQLASDVERHSSDLPIVARQDHLGYRLRKFARRHRQALTAAAVTVVLVGGLLVALRRQAELIDRTNARAERVSEVLIERLAAAGPNERTGAAGPREVLDLALRQPGGRLRDEPSALAEMLETMGRVYRQAGLVEDARWLLEESLSVRRSLPGSDDLAIASSLHSLGSALLGSGELERGESLLRQALALRRRRATGATWAVAESLEALAKHSWRMGALDRAETLLVESLEVRLAICPDSAWTARGLSDLGSFRLEQLQLAQAVSLQARAEAIRERLSPTHLDAPRTIEDRALLFFARGETRTAEGLFRQAVGLQGEVGGEFHEALAVALLWQARSLIPQGRYQEAIDALRQALAVRRRLQLGPGPTEADLLKQLGVALAGAGELEAGAALLRSVIASESGWLSPHHPRVARSRGLLADVLYAEGDLAGAERSYRRAAGDLVDHPEWAFGAGSEPRLALARLRLEHGDSEPAVVVAEARQLLALLAARHPEGHWRIGQAQSLLGSALALAVGEPESESLLASGLETLELRLGVNAPRTRRAAGRLDRYWAGRTVPLG